MSIDLYEHYFDQWEKSCVEIERLNMVNQNLRDELSRLKQSIKLPKDFNVVRLSITQSWLHILNA